MIEIKKIEMLGDASDAQIFQIIKSLNNAITEITLLKEQVNRHDKGINGNGRPGIKEEVESLKTKILIIEKEFNELRSLYLGNGNQKGTKDKLEDFIVEYKRDKLEIEKTHQTWRFIIGIIVTLLAAWVSIDKILMAIRLK